MNSDVKKHTIIVEDMENKLRRQKKKQKEKILRIKKLLEKKLKFTKYPVDIIICMLWSIIILPVSLLDLEGTIRIILGLPFLLFIPGYVLIFALFPTIKTDRRIGIIERFAMSFGLSIAIVTLFGLGLNYTPWGIRLEPVLFSLFIFITLLGFLAIYRWIITKPNERFIISFNISLPKYQSKIDKTITIFLIAFIVIAAVSFIYVIITPKTGEKFTEFYLLGSEGNAEKYLRSMHVGENAEGIIGIVNHEHKIVNYSVEIWLVNQTIIYNELEQENYTIINNMWFIDKITTTLDHSSIEFGQPWASQWEYNYSFTIDKKGFFKLAFLLYKTPTEKYRSFKDYRNESEQIINSSFETIHLWINISDIPKISNVLANPPWILPGDFINISCTVFDADGIDEVFLNIRDPNRNVHNFSITNNKTGNIYYYNNTYNISGKYNYFIWVKDKTNKTKESIVTQFTVTDIPIISEVWTYPSSTHQGGFLRISCLLYDLDGIDEVFLNISYPDGTTHNFSITNNRTGLIYSCNQIYMLAGNYSYFIWVNDTYGNTNTSPSQQFSVTVFPAVYDILAVPSLAPQTGFVNISCTVFDVDGIDEVFLNISYPDGTIQNFSIAKYRIGDTYYYNQKYTTVGEFSYFIWAIDKTGKSITSPVSKFSVTDRPYISNVFTTPTSTLQGRRINISCIVFDAMGVDEVYLNITYPDDTVQNFSITNNKNGDIYYYNQTYTTVGIYNYFIWAKDIEDKSSNSKVSQFLVTDLPYISDVLANPTSTLQDGHINISCKVFDNDGVSEVYLNITYPDDTMENLSITENYTKPIYYCNRTYSIGGEYSYFIWAKDIFENINISDVKKFSVIIS